MTVVKVLSIRQPHIDAILRGDKKVENRGGLYPWKYRGRIYLHASGQHPLLPTGLILGYADLVDCVEVDVLRTLATAMRDGRNQLRQRPRMHQEHIAALREEYADLWDRLQVWKRTDRDCQLRHVYGPWCYLLEHPVRLRKPIPAKGWLGLWNFELKRAVPSA